MTERFEITSILQRALVNDPAVFGESVPGTEAEPGVYMESVHYLMKVVSGAPNIRPAWFFDTAEQGEGLNDIGTHLVDLVQWTLFPDQAIDYHAEVKVLAAQRWPTTDLAAGFSARHGEPRVSRQPGAARQGRVARVLLQHPGDVHAPRHPREVERDLGLGAARRDPATRHFAFYRGARARVEVRQGQADRYKPELYVIPAAGCRQGAVLASVQARIAALAASYPGVTAEDRGAEIHIVIPDAFRVGHEAHFAQVTANFLEYLRNRRALPAWERQNMLAQVRRHDDRRGDEPEGGLSARAPHRAMSPRRFPAACDEVVR